ncbi:putative zinc-binding protein [Pseudodesulfovibrio sp. zrk46]|uniref:putative zinc-binding protein n=1 Tax=Pseudodesulfovibrio sp. zrk46 TaxID=2725288 RepID=UPI00144971EB|nr:putative zinc-binding protein [Pseudodesulfovibrio sp. zrk46]QJB56837.1 zinc-binding protein [Pseudodesulfovibrio sp. zrk46]
MSNCTSTCDSSQTSTLVFSCSGAADVGEVTDQAARELARTGTAKMFCLAGVGGKVSNIMNTIKAADKLIVIDGCPLNCAKKTLQDAGFTEFEHLQLTDLEMTKGTTPATENNIKKVVNVMLDRV